MPGDRERVATPPPATIVRALLWCAALGRAPSRRDGRVAEGARLESVYTGNRIVGSNPTPSASQVNKVAEYQTVANDPARLPTNVPTNRVRRLTRTRSFHFTEGVVCRGPPGQPSRLDAR